jgi:hypothetical protein
MGHNAWVVLPSSASWFASAPRRHGGVEDACRARERRVVGAEPMRTAVG